MLIKVVCVLGGARAISWCLKAGAWGGHLCDDDSGVSLLAQHEALRQWPSTAQRNIVL